MKRPMDIRQTEDQSNTLYSEKYDEFYHCKGGALAKAKHIFLEPVGIGASPRHGREWRILEAGFGAGLNFFVTADEIAKLGSSLEYTALENDLLPADAFEELNYGSLIENRIIFDAFIQSRRNVESSRMPCEKSINLGASITLRLMLGDASVATLPNDYFDWVYLDAFSPRHNPELWTENFLQTLFDSLVENGGLCTYCVQGEFRRRLKRAGFQAEKRPGIRYKREVLTARKPAMSETASNATQS